MIRMTSSPAVHRRPARRHAGFTLVEVLVALVVLAVGLLGIAGLYVEGLRAGRTAVYRSAAVTLASDMADRIRANPGGNYAGNGPGTGANNGCVNGAGDCNPNMLAQDDWWRWMRDVGRRLPAGATTTVTVQPLPPVTQYVITVSWPEVGQEAPVSYSLAIQL
jgi:type IV pilus assembly protein PilV